MSPTVKLALVEAELERWLVDPRGEPERGRVHADRVARILHLTYDTPTRGVIDSS